MITESKTVDPYWVRIYIAGDLARIEEVCREYCEKGGCVNVSATNYIYTYGEQSGAVVEFINYPRFPEHPAKIWYKAIWLAKGIAERCHQKSWTIMAPDRSAYYERKWRE